MPLGQSTSGCIFARTESISRRLKAAYIAVSSSCLDSICLVPPASSFSRVLLLVVVAHEAAVDDVGASGDGGGFFGGEKGGQSGYVVGGAEAAKRDVGEEGVELGLVRQQGLVDWSGDGSRGDVVDGD